MSETPSSKRGAQGDRSHEHNVQGEFETRREAEMTVERLVQEYGVARERVLVAASGSENAAGNEQVGSDGAADATPPEGRDDAALNGAIIVSVDLEDEALAGKVRSAFAEFDASAVDQD